MTTKHRTLIASLTATAMLIVLMALPKPAQAQWVVVDPANVLQTTLVDLQQVQSYQQQVMQYLTQVQQYNNMIQNTARAPLVIIQQVAATVQGLVNTINTLGALEAQYGSLPAYLSKFATLTTYQAHACFTRLGCAGGPLVGLQQTNQLGSSAKYNAINASFQNIHAQQQQIQTDAINVQQLQTNATGATGQMQALQYGNQLTAAVLNQLLQIRALLISEQNMVATETQANANTLAQQQASNTNFHTLGPQQPVQNDLTLQQWYTF